MIEAMAEDIAAGMARRGYPVAPGSVIAALMPALADVLVEIIGVPHRE